MGRLAPCQSWQNCRSVNGQRKLPECSSIQLTIKLLPLGTGCLHLEDDIRFTFTPSRHFSGRGLTRNQGLWGGFAINAGSGGSVYFTGDGGYGAHFSEIGRRCGPFDMVFPDSGQYNRAWAQVHMFPEQAAIAVKDARGRIACPAHMGKFTLAWHPWNEPARRFAKKAQELALEYRLPVIGSINRIDGGGRSGDLQKRQ